MRISVAIAIAVLAAGCSDDAATTEGAGASSSTGDTSTSTNGSAQEELVAGTRLKVRKLVSDDGAEQQIGFYDTQAQQNCAFALASDGSTRCLPTSSLQGGIYYVDPGCTQPIVTGCDDGAPYVRVVAPSSCAVGGAAVRVFARSDTQPSMQPFVGTPGNCTQGVFAGGVGEVLLTGAEAPPAFFVQATESVE